MDHQDSEEVDSGTETAETGIDSVVIAATVVEIDQCGSGEDHRGTGTETETGTDQEGRSEDSSGTLTVGKIVRASGIGIES